MAAGALMVSRAAVLLVVVGIGGAVALAVRVGRAPDALPAYDPLALAVSRGTRADNPESGVPPMCYTVTGGVSNPCWTCHTDTLSPNTLGDWPLQADYKFSAAARENHWTNVFEDRSAAIAAISDDEALAWIREDNYAPLVAALAGRADYPGWVPDLDFARGFDEAGFAADGSGWRAIRYKPFPGTFWPTNGSTDDAFVRLPAAFRSDATGMPSRAVYEANLEILERAIAADPRVGTSGLGLPARYAGGAASVAVRRYVYPEGTEFLHTVRYVDPDAPSLLSRRMKEVRYSRKVKELDDWGILRAWEREGEEKDEGRLPVYAGSPAVGLANSFGWQLQGFIEDAHGRLRLQTFEEHRFCMGCHSSVGVTVDHTFALARKIPGPEGWRWQDLRGMYDAPQAGHTAGEVLTYFRRAGGGDELRANEEILARFFPDGNLDEAAVRRAGRGGDRDLAWLLAPSRARALLLDKAYMVLVHAQSFALGRDPLPAPPSRVFKRIEDESTHLAENGRVYLDGRLHLDWR